MADAWIDPSGGVFTIPSMNHDDWARTRGATTKKLMRNGWLQVAGDVLRAFQPIRGPALQAAKPLMSGSVWVSLVYENRNSEFRIETDAFQRRRLIRHPPHR